MDRHSLPGLSNFSLLMVGLYGHGQALVLVPRAIRHRRVPIIVSGGGEWLKRAGR